MAPGRLVDANIRPRLEESDEAEFEDEYDEDEPYARFNNVVDEYPESMSEDETFNRRGRTQEDDESTDAEGEEDDRAGEEDDEQVRNQISRTSFGALKQAQDSILRKRKRGSETNEDQEKKLAALRSRLKDLRSKSQHARGKREDHGEKTRSSHNRDAGNETQDSDSDSAPSDEGAPMKSRTSKHAPAAQSSKHQVTRKRAVIDVPKRNYRDPRFDALHTQQSSNLQDHSEKAYAFLTDYQRSEIHSLRAAIKATKDEDDKATLRRKMVSMENRLKAQATRERERDIVRRHRREEKERVEQGKSPYYLKRKDVKQRALEEKFHAMKGKEREKVMERRRRKEGQREKRKIPMARRRPRVEG